jgi:hypothetical protein
MFDLWIVLLLAVGFAIGWGARGCADGQQVAPRPEISATAGDRHSVKAMAPAGPISAP